MTTYTLDFAECFHEFIGDNVFEDSTIYHTKTLKWVRYDAKFKWLRVTPFLATKLFNSGERISMGVYHAYDCYWEVPAESTYFSLAITIKPIFLPIFELAEIEYKEKSRQLSNNKRAA